MVTGGLIPMEVFEEHPGIVRLLEGLRSIGRVVVYDRRGVGLSDPVTDWGRPMLEQWAEDLASVVAASGVQRAAVFAWDSTGIATRAAADHPDAFERLVLFQPVDGEHWTGWVADRLTHVRRSMIGGDSENDLLAELAPSHAADPTFRAWYERAGRVGASPATAARIWDAFTASEITHSLADVHHATLVLHRPESLYVPSEAVHYVFERLPDAVEVEVDGDAHWPFLGDVDAIVDEIAEFLVGERNLLAPERTLAAVLFTDLVDSTQRAVAVGDATWKALLDRHDRAARQSVTRCSGRVVKTTGDGVLALFPSAGGAIRAARRLRDELVADDLRIRVGVHVGDVDRRGDDVSGLAVNIAARVMAEAEGDEIVVTTSVLAATAGQGMSFEPIGAHELKGIPGRWKLFRLMEH
jgi:class 3 adenylate cyclase/pimeloyl-ACP methyl ester carboxylesterase